MVENSPRAWSSKRLQLFSVMRLPDTSIRLGGWHSGRTSFKKIGHRDRENQVGTTIAVCLQCLILVSTIATVYATNTTTEVSPDVTIALSQVTQLLIRHKNSEARERLKALSPRFSSMRDGEPQRVQYDYLLAACSEQSGQFLKAAQLYKQLGDHCVGADNSYNFTVVSDAAIYRLKHHGSIPSPCSTQTVDGRKRNFALGSHYTHIDSEGARRFFQTLLPFPKEYPYLQYSLFQVNVYKPNVREAIIHATAFLHALKSCERTSALALSARKYVLAQVNRWVLSHRHHPFTSEEFALIKDGLIAARVPNDEHFQNALNTIVCTARMVEDANPDLSMKLLSLARCLTGDSPEVCVSKLKYYPEYFSMYVELGADKYLVDNIKYTCDKRTWSKEFRKLYEMSKRRKKGKSLLFLVETARAETDPLLKTVRFKECAQEALAEKREGDAINFLDEAYQACPETNSSEKRKLLVRKFSILLNCGVKLGPLPAELQSAADQAVLVGGATVSDHPGQWFLGVPKKILPSMLRKIDAISQKLNHANGEEKARLLVQRAELYLLIDDENKCVSDLEKILPDDRDRRWYAIRIASISKDKQDFSSSEKQELLAKLLASE